MILNGLYVNSKSGRPSEKVRNLKRFAKEWGEFEDTEALNFNEGDAEFISGSLHLGDGTLDKYHQMADALNGDT